jgi:UDP-N-acetylglucosamine--N-acetylmuramyl-(pentapeptide) pyrophosphoryl-undecaprenol N-acetylglucosamine transferase
MTAAAAVAAALPSSIRDRYRPQAFLHESMSEALVAADVVLGRAGSSTCAEVAAVGVAAILVPYPHAGDHQRANAAWLADQGAARLVPDADLDGPRLELELATLRDARARLELATAARALGRPEAAATIAAHLLALADGGRA